MTNGREPDFGVRFIILKRVRLRTLVLLAVWLWPVSALLAAGTYYVSTSGSSANTGLSTSSTWPLTYAISQAGASSTIIVMPGVYSGGFSISTSGLTLKSQVKWGAKISGGSSVINVYPPNSASGVTIDGFEITGAPNNSGIYITCPNTTVRNCWVHHCGNSTSFDGLEAHYQNGTLIESCLFEYNGADIYGHGIYVSGTNIVIRGNVCRHNAGAGVQVWRDPSDGNANSLNVRVYNNLFYGNGNWGLVYGDSLGNPIYLYDNTIVASQNYAVGAGQSGRLLMTNNILIGAKSVLNLWSSATAAGDYNVLPSAEFSQAHGVITSSPGFVSPSSGLYWLTSGSPARGKALAGLCGPVDFFGNAQSSVVDIGAVQYSSALASDTRVLDPSGTNPDYWAALGSTGTGTPNISVTPGSQNFGSIAVGTIADRSFTVQNTGSGTLSGTATVPAPFSIVSGGSYSLGASASQAVTVRFSPTATGTATQTLAFSGANGATASVTGAATNTVVGPNVSPITTDAPDVDANAAGLQIYAGTTVTCQGSASDPNGRSLTWQWIYTVNGGSEWVFLSGTGTVAPAKWACPTNAAGNTYVWKLRVSNGLVSSESTLTMGVVTPPPPPGALDFAAGACVYTAPFVLSNGSLSQPAYTELTNGGQACFTFSITNAGWYVVRGSVSAPDTSHNSFWVNIDAQPQDPYMTWDILPTNGYEQRFVSWRGNGTDGSPQIGLTMFNLPLGTHQLIVRGREGNTLLQSVSILKLPNSPRNVRVMAGG